jgi:hypothetical protein
MTHDETHDAPGEPRGRPVPASAQQHRIATATVRMIGTVEEILPARGSATPTSDSVRLLRMLDGVMLGMFRAPADPDWSEVAWTGLPRAGEQTRIRSAQFRSYLGVRFYEETGKVLREARMQEIVLLLCGTIRAAKDKEDAARYIGASR